VENLLLLLNRLPPDITDGLGLVKKHFKDFTIFYTEHYSIMREDVGKSVLILERPRNCVYFS
jgi:hypothetical protein